MLLELLFVASMSLQQVHPCDEVLPVNPSLVAPVLAGFCSENPSLTNARFYVDSALVWSGTPTRMTSANLEGLYYYETPRITVPRGTHSAQVDTTEGAEPMLESYTFTIINRGQARKIRVSGGGE